MKQKVVSFIILAILLNLTLISPNPVYSAENPWASKASMNAARSRLGVAEVNGRVYAIGGDDTHLSGNCIGPSIGSLVNITEEYNPQTNTWTTKTSMPTARCSFAIAVYDNKIYCIGGCTSYNSWTGANEVYDPTTDTWETKRAMPTPRMDLQAHVANGKIYLIGGTNSYGSGAYLAVNEVYDPATNTWASATPPPFEFTSGASTDLGGKFYFLAQASVLDLGAFIEIYSPSQDSWSVGASAPTYGGISATACAATSSKPERIFFFDESSTFSYTPSLDKWESGTSMPSKRGFPGIAYADGTFYVVGGIPAPFIGYIVITASTAKVEQYTPNEHLTVTGDNKIYIRADGSIEPSTANITTTDKFTYTFTGDNFRRLIIERDNIVLDGKGFTIQGDNDVYTYGITLFQRHQVTIKNVTVKEFQTAGIGMENSNQITIFGNTLKGSLNEGIRAFASSNNLIAGNNIIDNKYMGGIHFFEGSSNNTITGNNIAGNGKSFILEDSSGNHIYHNNIDEGDQTYQHAYITEGCSNTWDNGYSSGGNHWASMTVTDADGDGIGDTPHVINAVNKDRYPLMVPAEIPQELETAPQPSPSASPDPIASTSETPSTSASTTSTPSQSPSLTQSNPEDTSQPPTQTPTDPENPHANTDSDQSGFPYGVIVALIAAISSVAVIVILLKRRR